MEVDLTELDDWLGTLEELQLGLDRPSSHTTADLSAQRHTGKPSSYVNQAYSNGPKSPLRKAGDVNMQTISPPPLSPAVRISPVQEQRNNKDASAEGDLNSLLRELQVVEERMRILEQDDTTACQRYSLASPVVYQSKPLMASRLSTGLSNPSNYQNSCNSPPTPFGYERRQVSAQWAAKLNQDNHHHLHAPKLDRYSQQAPVSLHNGNSTGISASDLGHHRLQSAQSYGTASSALPWPSSPRDKQTQAEYPAEKSVSASQTTLVNAPTNPCSEPSQVLPPIRLADVEMTRQGISSPPPPTRYLTKPLLVQNHSDHQPLMEQLRVFQAAGGSPTNCQMSPAAQLEQVRNHSMPSSPATSRGTPVLVETSAAGSSQFSASPVARNSVGRTLSNLSPLLVVPPNGVNETGPLAGKAERSPLAGEMNSNQFRQGLSLGKGDLAGDKSPMESSVLPFAGDRLSSSLSPDSSLSEQSLSDATDYSRPSDRTTDCNNARRPIFVRVFRHDRTTKAVLVGENTTAGEVASMLIEKNFTQPSTSMVLVEKVPSMKIERIFEEHQRVADCILSWSTQSQNMLFFEDRTDQFGFIETPNLWLGDSFVQKHGYQSPESLQNALHNLDKVGFPEYRDYLYIKKPGEKSWSRRLCVLRSSGLYTSKKNKKSLNPSDLIRILILDSRLQLYTTTGGWSRMRAPTPHGFAFKPYSAHDLSSTHVFCFCAADEMTLRQWVCRLRIAKYGRQLLFDYRTACERVQRLAAIRHGFIGSSLLCLSTSPMSVQLHRKSVIDMLGQSGQSALSAAESTSSLVSNSTDSPSVIQRLSPETVGQALHSPNGQTPGKHVNWAKLGRQSPSPIPFRSRNSAGGNRASADYTPKKADHTSPGLKQQSLPHSSLNDIDHQAGRMCRSPTQGYSVNPYYASPRMMNGNRLLPSGAAQRPMI